MKPLEFKFQMLTMLKLINEGKDVGSVSSTGLRKLANYISKRHIKQMAHEIVSTPNLDVSEFLYRNVPMFHASKKENFFREIAEGQSSGEIDGMVVDNFSAFMVSRVLDKLSDDQRVRLLNKPLQEILAISYKLSSRSEF